MINTAINEQDDDRESRLQEPFLDNSLQLLDEEEQILKEEEIRETLANNLALGNLDFFTKVAKTQVDDFFKGLLYKVDLSQLYKIVDTCYYSQAMPFCPILVENMHQELKDGDKKYHLLVWSEKGELIFETELSQPPVSWAITFRYLLYKPHTDDQLDDEESYYIVDLVRNQKYRVDTQGIPEIQQIEKPMIGYCNKCLYISDSNKIYILNLSNLTDQELINQYRIKRLPICTISLGPRVINHGFLIKQQLVKGEPTSPQQDSYVALTMCCETQDNQFDFAMLIYYPAEFAKSPNNPINHYTIKQISPVVARKVQNDPVIQFKTVFDNQPDPIPYSIALRQSKAVDIYWNYNLKDTIEINPSKPAIANVELNFYAFYLEDIKGNIRVIELNKNGNVCHKEARLLTMDDDPMTLHQYAHQKSCQHNNLFQAHCLINTSYFVAHDESIYIFDLIEGSWVNNNFKLKGRVLYMFPQRDSNREQHVMILMSDGSVATLSNIDQRYTDPKQWYLNEESEFKLAGIPIQIVQDQQRSSVVYILTQDNNNQELQIMFKCKLYAVTENIINQEYPSLIMQLQYNQLKSQVALYVRNPRGGSIKVIEAQVKIVNEQTQIITKVVKNIQFDDSVITVDDLPHNCIAKEIDDTLILVSKKNIYRVNIGMQTTEIIPNCNIISIQVIDNDFCYAYIQNEATFSQQNPSGMKIFSLSYLLQNNKLFLMDIESTIGSINNVVGFTADSQRLIYLKNSEMIHIVPPLHRTTINFMGMSSRNNYLATKKYKDKFFALDRYNTITTWDAVYGKIITQIKIANNLDLQSYTMFGYDMKNADMTYVREWNQPYSLIIDSQEAQNNINLKLLSQVGQIIDESKYGQLLSNDIQGCISYPEQDEQKMKFKNFKVIEIINETTIAVHMSFVHHYYSSPKQIHKIIVSNDCQIMIEKLINQRVNIYERNISLAKDEWNFVRRFTEFPHELSSLSQNLYLFTPNLRKYLDIDSETYEFVIIDCLEPNTNCPRLKISNLIMEDEKQDLSIIIRRFKWIDNQSFLFCSKDGLEMKYEIDFLNNTINEKTSSQIPAFFDLSDASQIYVETQPLPLGSIQRRLLRKHQELKRKRFIFGSKETSKILDALISIDYNIQGKIGMMAIELPFSWILWKIIERIASGRFKNLFMLDDINLQVMCLNIMPGCKTILHKFDENSSLLEQILSRIPVSTEQFEMPFIADLKGRTRLHYCVDTQDIKTGGLLMKYLANAPLDHHSREIANLIPDLIRLKVPFLTQYLDQRIISTQYISQIKRGAIKTKKETFEPGMMIASIWANQDHIKKGLFQSSSVKNQLKLLETEVKLEFVDLPELNDINSNTFRKFFDELKDTDNIYAAQLFQSKAIKYIIEYHWRINRYYTLKSLFIPFFIYLVTFFIYTNFTDELIDMQVFSKYQIYPWLVNIGFLIVLSIYFIKNEVNQIMNSGLRYLLEPWNYIDMVPPVVVLWIAVINSLGIDSSLEGILKSVGSLFMWLKLLYFLRIYKTTGYLIRMIVQVIQEMKVFLLVLLITMIAVADAQISFQPYDKDLDQITGLVNFVGHNLSRFFASVNSTYQMILGGDDFTAQDQYQFAASILIVFTKLFVMIVMLNLVISIIGDTFGRVKQNSINEYYKEISCVISENSYLIPEEVKQSRKAKPGELLLVSTKIGDSYLTNEEVDLGMLQQTSVLVPDDYIQIKQLINEGLSGLQDYIKQSINPSQPNPLVPGSSIINSVNN